MLSGDRQVIMRRGLAASLRVALLTAILALLVLGLHVSAASAQDDDSGGVLIFARIANGEPGGEGIYIINADGSGEQPLALFEEIGYPYHLDSGGYRCPVWSPDGSQIAFNGALDGRSYLVVMDGDGSNARTVYEVQNDPTTTRQIHFPRWIPGTERISFGYTEASPTTGDVSVNGVRSIDLDGTALQSIRDDVVLTYDSGAPVQIGTMLDSFLTFAHAWSPDASQLAVSSLNNRIFLMDASGTTMRPLESSLWAAGGVDWSPDGSRIASSHFYVPSYTPDDTDLREIVPMPTDVLNETIESVAWSPDGSQIAYTSYVIDIAASDTQWYIKLVVVDVATGEQREIVRTPNFGRGGYPWAVSCVDWRPE